MTTEQQVLDAIYAALDEVNETRPPAKRVTRDLDAQLVGKGGVLDSLGLVNLAVAIEDQLDARLGVEVALTRDLAISPEQSPFRSLRILAAHVVARSAS